MGTTGAIIDVDSYWKLTPLWKVGLAHKLSWGRAFARSRASGNRRRGAKGRRRLAYLRQKPGASKTSKVKISRRPRSMAQVHTQVCKSVSTA